MSTSVSKKEIKELVIERLKTLSQEKKIVIAGEGEFTKEEMIDHVQRGDRLGQKIIQIQLYFLRSFKSGGPGSH
ncbi:MAG: hypothetical protein M1514_03365 [Patescibacteria group bacterium]|nr:hypothetical protein [Patescibacteria group bacterium]